VKPKLHRPQAISDDGQAQRFRIQATRSFKRGR
jgi:hypothetical protein